MLIYQRVFTPFSCFDRYAIPQSETIFSITVSVSSQDHTTKSTGASGLDPCYSLAPWPDQTISTRGENWQISSRPKSNSDDMNNIVMSIMVSMVMLDPD